MAANHSPTEMKGNFVLKTAPRHMMYCRMVHVTWLSFSPQLCFLTNFLRVGSIIFSKVWVPVDLIQCGICTYPTNFQRCLPLSLCGVLKYYLLTSLSTIDADWCSGWTELSWCVMSFVLWTDHCGRSIFDVDQNVKMSSEESYSITLGLNWSLQYLQKKRQWRLKIGVDAAM